MAYSELYSSQILNCFIYVWRIDALIDYLDYPAYLTIYSIELSIFLVTKPKSCKYIYTGVTQGRGQEGGALLLPLFGETFFL